jgi:hypothetical protein
MEELKRLTREKREQIDKDPHSVWLDELEVREKAMENEDAIEAEDADAVAA